MQRTTKALTAVALMLVPATLVAAGQLEVPSQFATIQSAIDAADGGDTVVVAVGTYHEVLDLRGKAITVRSAAGAKYTIIDASGIGGSVVRATSGEGPGTVLEGFTLTGGTGTLVGTRYQGGGMYNANSSPTVIACIFKENTLSAWEFGIEGSGGGMFNHMSDPIVSDCTFEANALLGCSGWAHGGAGMFNHASRPTITRSVFIDNYGNNGSGIMNFAGSDPVVTNCAFIGNVATYSGGGMNVSDGSSATVTNCAFVGNIAFHGAGVYATRSTVSLTNCTLTRNAADRTGGGLYTLLADSAATVVNSIFWDNSAAEQPASREIASEMGPAPLVGHTLVATGYAGDGNLTGDPRFVDPIGPDGEAGTKDDDLSLAPDSPCIDAGDAAALPADAADLDDDGDTTEATPLDMADVLREQGARVDVGQYEYGTEGGGSGGACPADTDGNGSVDFEDLMAVLGDWGACSGCDGDVDADGFVQFADLLAVLVSWGECP